MNNYYKHPAETYVFINNIYIDDVYRIDFSMDQSRFPIYGYQDELYGHITRGRKKVVGNIFINFSSPGYLYAALSNKDKQSPDVSSLLRNGISPYSAAEAEMAQLNKELQDIFIENLSIEDKRKRISGLMSKASRAGLSKKLADTLRYAFGTDSTKFVDKGLVEPTDQNLLPFDIQIYYGHPNDGGSIIREITDCSLLGTNQVISAAGHPGGDLSSSAQVILEVYPFIGREIKTKQT